MTPWHDVRFAYRLLLKERWSTAVAVLALALGLGANTAVFTFVNAVLLRGLPFSEPDRIMSFGSVDARGRPAGVSRLDLDDLRDSSRSYKIVTALLGAPMNVSDEALPAEQFGGTYTEANLFQLIGRPPSRGRDFRREDDVVGAEPVVIIGYTVWQNRYGGDPAIIGRTDLDGSAGHETAIVNQQFVRMHFNAEDPLDRRITLFDATPSIQTSPPKTVTIVGVVPTVRQRNSQDRDPDPVVYFPYAVEAPLLNGRSAAHLNAAERARVRNREIGFIFQSFNLIGDLTVFENVELPLTYRGMSAVERSSRVQAALERVGMTHRAKHLPGQLSGGQQQPVAVARAVAGEPSMLLADEPTGNLDSKSGESVMSLLAELHQGGATICMVTHDARYARHAGRHVHLFDGRTVANPVTEPVA